MSAPLKYIVRPIHWMVIINLLFLNLHLGFFCWRIAAIAIHVVSTEFFNLSKSCTHFQLLHTFINSWYCVSEHAYLSFMLFSICMLLRGFACLDMHIKSLFVLWRKLCSDTQKNGRCFCQSMTVLFRCTINLVKSIYFICNFLYSLYFLIRLFLSPL